MTICYVVDTVIEDNGRIVQTVTEEFRDIRRAVLRRVAETSEEQIRTALIQLGWTPPTKKG